LSGTANSLRLKYPEYLGKYCKTKNEVSKYSLLLSCLHASLPKKSLTANLFVKRLERKLLYGLGGF